MQISRARAEECTQMRMLMHAALNAMLNLCRHFASLCMLHLNIRSLCQGSGPSTQPNPYFPHFQVNKPAMPMYTYLFYFTVKLLFSDLNRCRVWLVYSPVAAQTTSSHSNMLLKCSSLSQEKGEPRVQQHLNSVRTRSADHEIRDNSKQACFLTSK